MKLLKGKIGIVIILLILFCLIGYNIRKGNVRDQELQKEYPTLKNEKRLDGVVMFKYDFMANQYRDFLSISRVTVYNEKFSIIADEIEHLNPKGINEIVDVGDLIFKASNNDTIILKKKDGKVYTLLRRDELFPR